MTTTALHPGSTTGLTGDMMTAAGTTAADTLPGSFAAPPATAVASALSQAIAATP